MKMSRAISLYYTIMTKTIPWKPRYFDIGVNLSDSMFQGYYHHSSHRYHPCDIPEIIDRAHLFNVDRMLVTASSIKESEDHLHLCAKYPNKFFSTAGVHPCQVASEFYVKSGDEFTDELVPDVEAKLQQLKQLVIQGHASGTIKAFGEFGLDYDRFHFLNRNQQITMFKKQLGVIASLKHLKLPLFLHQRNACDDFVEIIKPFIERGDIEKGNGVVHSFTGTKEELAKMLDLGFFISVNGCSLKTEENLEVAKLIPIDRLLIETDAPWCEVRKSHASYKYVTPYPNIFYPEIQPENVPEAVEEPQEKTKKQAPKKKNQAIKLDELLPFPTIKKENFEKHQKAVEELKLTKRDDETRVGEFAAPLVKSRNEPVFVGLIAEILCNLHGLKTENEIKDFVDTVFENSCKLFQVDIHS